MRSITIHIVPFYPCTTLVFKTDFKTKCYEVPTECLYIYIFIYRSIVIFIGYY